MNVGTASYCTWNVKTTAAITVLIDMLVDYNANIIALQEVGLDGSDLP